MSLARRRAPPPARDAASAPVSVIVPTYNEAGSIVAFLGELLTVLEKHEIDHEVLVVDDASPDGTADLVESHFAGREQVRLLRRHGSRGLAVSIRDGLARAEGDVFVVMDSDFNHDPQVVPLLLKVLADFDLVSGSRFAPGGGMYSRWRQLGSFVMNLFVRVVLQTQIQDNLSGFFAVRRELLEPLPAARIFFGYGDYYFRLLYHAQRRGARILEVPVVYRSREGGGSKTPLLRTFLRYGFEVLRLRLGTLLRAEPRLPR
jgi:dolichol-phosphate mannosyltransferase